VETVHLVWRYATCDRLVKKRKCRELWIVRINAATRQCGTTYSKLMGLLNSAEIQIDRKILADVAVLDFPVFQRIVQSVTGA